MQVIRNIIREDPVTRIAVAQCGRFAFAVCYRPVAGQPVIPVGEPWLFPSQLTAFRRWDNLLRQEVTK